MEGNADDVRHEFMLLVGITKHWKTVYQLDNVQRVQKAAARVEEYDASEGQASFQTDPHGGFVLGIISKSIQTNHDDQSDKHDAHQKYLRHKISVVFSRRDERRQQNGKLGRDEEDEEFDGSYGTVVCFIGDRTTGSTIHGRHIR